MNEIFTEENYERMIQKLFHRFPSFQKTGSAAYKPGIANMEFADQLMGHPHRKYRIIHVAGTNGKGSVSNMLASVLASAGHKVGLYTSPHILDFRERMRVIEAGSGAETVCMLLISKQEVWDFVAQWQDTFDHLDMSFFEITTLMALDWFARQEVDLKQILEEAVLSFKGDIMQLPPMYSAIKKDGVRLYELARQGIEIEREERQVHISSIAITDSAENEYEIEVHCS